jgi:site-specific DNA-methyltransferase (adenine-specific)
MKVPVVIGDATLYLGDCIDTLKSLPAQSIDCVLTDPPYSSGTRREGAKGIRKSMLRETDGEDWFPNDCLTTDGFWWLMHSNAVQWKRLCRVGSHILAFIDWRMWHHMTGAVESADLRRFGMLVWDKTFFGMGMFFRNQHELIMHFTNGTGKAASRHDIGNVLSFAPIRNGEHFTEKPVDLCHELLSVVTEPEDVVLDPFMGSGTTGVACAKLGRRFIGIEIEPKYFDIACRRIEAAYAQPDMFVTPPAKPVQEAML